MVGGTGSFDSELMRAVPRVFVKGGAEGVHCGCVPHAGLGIALKCDDGAGRAGEVAMASVLTSLDVWTPEEKRQLEGFRHHGLSNWNKIEVGQVVAAL
jgi:L-asparaginase II